MKTFILTVDESHEEAIRALAKSLGLELLEMTEKEENDSLLIAMEEGKKYGRMTEAESKAFLDNLGK